MAELRLITPEQKAKNDFISNKGRGVEKVRKVVSLEDNKSISIVGLIFGQTGSGKTKFAAQLACGSEKQGIPPQKFLILSTDPMDGNGTAVTMRGHILSQGKKELLSNVKIVVANTYEEVDDFLKDPYRGIDPSFDPDILMWDGFGYYQNYTLKKDIFEKSEGSTEEDPKRSFDKMDPAFQDMLFGTVDAANLFGNIRKRDGSPLHKIFTCGEDIIQKPVSSNPMEGTKWVDVAKPLLSGRGGKLIEAGPSFIIRSQIVTQSGADEGKRIYRYVISGNQNLIAKSREIVMDATVEADACLFWRKVLDAYGLNS